NPGARSRVAAERIRELGKHIGINNILVLGNRVKDAEDEKLIRDSLSDFEILGFLPEYDEVVSADREGVRPFETVNDIPAEVFKIVKKLENMKK
ncbi:MAG: carbon monoxide dehydrogenase, partial [Deltaproteobacteria bacterium]|nr:carbon monoxide dehydrogenase [Deltaproteobacteria bacterium]